MRGGGGWVLATESRETSGGTGGPQWSQTPRSKCSQEQSSEIPGPAHLQLPHSRPVHPTQQPHSSVCSFCCPPPCPFGLDMVPIRPLGSALSR